MNKNDLLDLKMQIDEAKETVSELRGKRDYMMNELKVQWGCKSLEEGEKKVSEFEKKIEKLDLAIKQGLKELEEKYV